jgi:hypothetical protein
MFGDIFNDHHNTGGNEMLRKPIHWIILTISLFVIFCAGCTSGTLQFSQPSAAAPSSTAIPEVVQPATDTPPATLAPTATETPRSTDTATVTPTPLPSDTPTPEASPTPDRVLPGLYGAGGCASTMIQANVQYELCVISVTVTRDRQMIFTMSWRLTNLPGMFTVTKESDQYNTSMYIEDNLGNRYNHISGGGEAYDSTVMEEGVPVMGTFVFPAPPVGAFTFDFHDKNKELVIKNLRLTDPIILYGDLKLSNTTYTLPYLLEHWGLVTGEAGESVLSNTRIQNCTLVERPFGTPQGKLKNHIQIGTLTYEIYGYIDQANNLGVREYVLVDGLEDLDPENLPLFVVTIPLDNSEACIYAASDLLAGVYGEEQ